MEAIQHLFRGFRDACQFQAVIKFFVRSKRLQSLFYQSFILNGVIFGLSVVLIDYVLTPLYMKFATPSSVEDMNSLHRFLSNLNYSIFFVLRNVFLILPLILFTSFYTYSNQIAEVTYEYKQRGSNSNAQTIDPLRIRRQMIESISDVLYKTGITTAYVALPPILGLLIPAPFSQIISLVTTTWLYAYYAFDFAFTYKRYVTKQRIAYFEKHWAYMTGFGLPVTLSTFFLPAGLSFSLYALLCPVFLVMAIFSAPPIVKSTPRMPLFWIVIKPLDFLILILKFFAG